MREHPESSPLRHREVTSAWPLGELGQRLIHTASPTVSSVQGLGHGEGPASAPRLPAEGQLQEASGQQTELTHSRLAENTHYELTTPARGEEARVLPSPAFAFSHLPADPASPRVSPPGKEGPCSSRARVSHVRGVTHSYVTYFIALATLK